VWKFVPPLLARQNKEFVPNATDVTWLPTKWCSAEKPWALWLHSPLESQEPSLHSVPSTWEVSQVTFQKRTNWLLDLTEKQRSKILKPLKAKIAKEKRSISLFPELLKLNWLTRKPV